MATGPTYAATVTATDQLSPVLLSIAKTLDAVNAKMGRLPAVATEAAQVGRWEKLSASMGGLSEKIGATGLAYRNMAGSVAAMIPQLGALTSVGAVGGLFTLTEHVAEQSALFARHAQQVGLSGAALSKWNFLAKMTDTDANSVTSSLGKFNVTMIKAMGGTDKVAAGLAAALKINLRDSKTGMIRGVDELFEDVATAIRINPNPQIRDAIARTFFGRGGLDLVPLLALPKGVREEYLKVQESLRYVKTAEQKRALDEFHVSWLQVGYAVDQVSISVGSKLAPALLPIVQGVRDWVGANRELIATMTTEKFTRISEAMKSVNWAEQAKSMRDMASSTGAAVDAFGGLKTVLEGIMVLKFAGWLAKVNPELLIMAAAFEAMTLHKNRKNLTLDVPGSDTEKDDGRPKGKTLNVAMDELSRNMTAITPMNALRGWWNSFTFPIVPGGVTEQSRVHLPLLPGMMGPENLPMLPAPSLGGGASAPPQITAPRDSRVDMTVRFENAPPGTRVEMNSVGPIHPPSITFGDAFHDTAR